VWATPENVVVSEDGALTTTLVGVLAERELAVTQVEATAFALGVPGDAGGRGLPVTQVEATAFALGIHEDTGSLTHTTATRRDAEALVWCLRHGAKRDLLSRFLHTP